MSKKKVLIVDDEPDIVETIRFSLEYENIECLSAYDGEEALQKARKENPDLIILDIMLPKINGYKISRLLKFDKNFRAIHIIMLTARTQEKDIQLGRETGADEYIIKPFDIDTLTRTIKKYLSTPVPSAQYALRPSSYSAGLKIPSIQWNSRY